MKMKTRKPKVVEQPPPVTPGVTRGMVREHAFRLYRDKLPEHPLTLEDWVLAEKDLVNSMEAEEVGVEV
jgi:hypothetical protein